MANANRDRTLTAEETEKLLSHLEKQIATALEATAENDELDDVFDQPVGDELPPELSDLKVRQEKLKALPVASQSLLPAGARRLWI